MQSQMDRTDAETQRLTDLFRQNLSLSKDQDGTHAGQPSLAEQDQQQTPIKYSISQHYTHSNHVSPALHPLQPPAHDQTSRLLIQNDIPPASLLRSQIELFERSNVDQQARLVILWRLAPPTHARNGGQQLADKFGKYQSMTLEQEEELAWMRYQRAFGGRDVQADVKVEQLCGRDSLLGEYFEDGCHDVETSSVPKLQTSVHGQIINHEIGDQSGQHDALEDHEMEDEEML